MNKVVCASGYFNPLHYGHVSYLQRAKEAGSTLVVIVNNDRQLRKQDANAGPAQPARDRVRLLRSLACVDMAIEAIDEDETVAATLRMVHPDVFANGGKQHATESEAQVCKDLGITMLDGLGIEVLFLQGYTQHYDWGKSRNKSAVALLAGEAHADSPVSRSKPFAELWMGDHPSGPAQVRTSSGHSTGCLIQALRRSPTVLGEQLAHDGQIPFLTKVLSIEKALSIQAHPDKKLAEKLHKEKPEIYKDGNHKPEIAIALTPFEALCGFRPLAEILHYMASVTELAEICGKAACQSVHDAVTSKNEEQQEAALKLAYSTMMRSSSEEVTRLLRLLVNRATSPSGKGASQKPTMAKVFKLVERLYDQFGEDIGIFSVFFLNYVEMNVGQCLYMGPNVPHAYLSGDIVECMACSDNVVRGGLTPKFKDLDVLCQMLVYRGGMPPEIRPIEVFPGMLRYEHQDIAEFQVSHLKLAPGQNRTYCFSGQGPAVGFVFRGNGSLGISGDFHRLTPGFTFLLAAGVDAYFEAKDDMEIFVSCCPPHFFRPRMRSSGRNASPQER